MAERFQQPLLSSLEPCLDFIFYREMSVGLIKTPLSLSCDTPSVSKHDSDDDNKITTFKYHLKYLCYSQCFSEKIPSSFIINELNIDYVRLSKD